MSQATSYPAARPQPRPAQSDNLPPALSLTGSETAQLRHALESVCAGAPDDGMSRPEFVQLGQALEHGLAPARQAMIRRFAAGALPALTISGFPADDTAGWALAAMSACSLDPLAYDDSPLPAVVTTLGAQPGGRPARAELGFRTEGPYFGINAMAAGHAAAPSAVVYAALDAEETRPVALLPLTDLLERLDDDSIAALHAPDFRQVRVGRRKADHIPVLGTGATGGTHVRFDWQGFDTQPNAPEAARAALEAFRLAVVSTPHQKVSLAAGEILLINNRTALHATDRLLDGTGRYLRILGRDADWQGRLACRWPVVAIT